MESTEIKEIIMALKDRNKILEKKYNTLIDSGDNISAKGAKKQLKVIKKLITKIKNSENIIFDGGINKNKINNNKKKSDKLDVYKQRDISIDLARSLLKELKQDELKNNISLKQDFIYQAENKIKELEKMQE